MPVVNVVTRDGTQHRLSGKDGCSIMEAMFLASKAADRTHDAVLRSRRFRFLPS